MYTQNAIQNWQALEADDEGAGTVLSLVRKDIMVLLFASAPHLTTWSYAEGWEMGLDIGASAPKYV